MAKNPAVPSHTASEPSQGGRWLLALSQGPWPVARSLDAVPPELVPTPLPEVSGAPCRCETGSTVAIAPKALVLLTVPWNGASEPRRGNPG